MTVIDSQQVNWYETYLFAQRQIGDLEYPLIGSPARIALPDNDPRKLAAVLDAGQHWALRIESRQLALADASRSISAAADWSAVGREINQRSRLRAERPWLARRAS